MQVELHRRVRLRQEAGALVRQPSPDEERAAVEAVLQQHDAAAEEAVLRPHEAVRAVEAVLLPVG